MALIALFLGSALAGLGAADDPSHGSNPLYHELIKQGLTIEGQKVTLAEPRLRDGLSKDQQQKILAGIAGSERAVADFVRPSVTAPHVLRLHDEKAGKGALVRRGELWFVIYAELDAVDPAGFAKSNGSRPMEAGNMRFSSKLLEPAELASRGLEAAEKTDQANEWYAHLSSRLLGRIQIEQTDRVATSRSAESWVVASRIEPRFDKDREYANQWSAIDSSGAAKGEPKPYAGGASVVKITHLSAVPGALLVEVHFLFTEPREWFDGAPILRSKISLVAQDRIRTLRSELAKSRKGLELRKDSDPVRAGGRSNPIEK